MIRYMEPILAAVGQPISTWTAVAVTVCIFYLLLRGARVVERERSRNGQPHTLADSAKLLFSGLAIVGALFCSSFFVLLGNPPYSRIAIPAIIIVGGCALTYIFNRRTAAK
jgi:Na+/H+ antiporter NhaD/arsenite permease-like protein